MTPCWEKVAISLGIEKPFKWISGLGPIGWNSTRSTVGSCTLVSTTPGSATGLGQSGWKAGWRKWTWGCWSMLSWTWVSSVPRWQKNVNSIPACIKKEQPVGAGRWLSCSTQIWWDYTLSTVFSFGPLPTRNTLRPWIMSREGHWGCEWAGAHILWEAAEGTGIIQSEEEEAQEDLIALYNYLKGGLVSWREDFST